MRAGDIQGHERERGVRGVRGRDVSERDRGNSLLGLPWQLVLGRDERRADGLPMQRGVRGSQRVSVQRMRCGVLQRGQRLDGMSGVWERHVLGGERRDGVLELPVEHQLAGGQRRGDGLHLLGWYGGVRRGAVLAVC